MLPESDQEKDPVPPIPVRDLERPGRGDPPRPEHQALWFALARREIASVVLVPADEGRPAAGLAYMLSEVGRRLGDHPVTAVVAEGNDYEFVTRTAALLAVTHRRQDRLPGASPLEVIVAIHPVTIDPLGLALVAAADAALLCVEVGRTRLSAARRSIAMIGRERFAGSVLVR